MAPDSVIVTYADGDSYTHFYKTVGDELRICGRSKWSSDNYEVVEFSDDQSQMYYKSSYYTLKD